MENKEFSQEERLEQVYQNAMLLMEGNLFEEAAGEFARISDYKDAAEKKLECEQKKEIERLEKIYAEADKAAGNRNVRSQEKAIAIFQRILGYRDADERVEAAKNAIEEILRKEREDREKAIEQAKQDELKVKERKKRMKRFAVIAALAAAACLVCVFLYHKLVVPAIRYRRGVEQMEAGAYDEAYLTLHGMNFLKSNDLVYSIAKERLKDAEVGSTVLFGAYPQEGRIWDPVIAPIEWQVLDKDGSKVLLISKYALDTLPYMRYDFEQLRLSISWEKSLLREWLNGTFLNTAFDEGELRMLQRTKITDDKGYFGKKDAGDQVFLLSIQEATTYFANDEDRKCIATPYALGFGAYRSSVGYTCLWWLRTPTNANKDTVEDKEMTYEQFYRVACVGTSGQIIDVGHDVLNRGYAVRPVIWVDTEASGE